MNSSSEQLSILLLVLLLLSSGDMVLSNTIIVAHGRDLNAGPLPMTSRLAFWTSECSQQLSKFGIVGRAGFGCLDRIEKGR